MTLSVRQAQQRQLEEVRAALDRPQYVHIRARILVHEHVHEDMPRRPCPCCGSVFARISREIPDGEVLIDRASGRRIRPDELRPETWARALAVAEHHEIAFRVSEVQAPLLLDDTDRHALIAGSQRAGKTYLACVWIARQWLHRGGKLRRFWFVGSTHDAAFELLRTIFDGDGKAPPILPASLALRRPKSSVGVGERLNTIMIDGSLFQLRRFGADPTGSRLKSRPIIAGITDEAAEMKHENALSALTGRCIDYRGRLFLATTPVGGSFLQSKIVEPCEDWARMPAADPLKVSGQHVGAQWISASLNMTQNPFIDPEGVRRDLAGADKESAAYQRDYLGLWVSGSGAMWRYDDERHTFIHEARSIADMLPFASRIVGTPQRRITAELVRRLFRRAPNPAYKGMKAANDRLLCGMDVNGGNRAMNTVVVEVTADEAAPDDKDRWHWWVFDVVQTWGGDALKHAETMASTAWARQFMPGAAESPLKGCGIIVDPQALFRDPTAHRYGADPRGLVEVFGDRGFDVRPPETKATSNGPTPVPYIGRRDSHMMITRLLHEGRLHVSQRCAGNLIKSFHRQEVSKDGCTPEKNDHLAGPVDALRYLVHACLHGHGPGSIEPPPDGARSGRQPWD